MTPNEHARSTGVWIWPLLVIGLPLLYWLSIGPFFHWEQSAHTQEQYHSRKKLERRVYAPVIWFEKHDPTGALFKIDYLYIQPWVKVPFDLAKLPAQ